MPPASSLRASRRNQDSSQVNSLNPLSGLLGPTLALGGVLGAGAGWPRTFCVSDVEMLVAPVTDLLAGRETLYGGWEGIARLLVQLWAQGPLAVDGGHCWEQAGQRTPMQGTSPISDLRPF